MGGLDCPGSGRQPVPGSVRLEYDQADAPHIVLAGLRMAKRPNPVYMLRVDEPFIVHTNEGHLNGAAGAYVAHDPISGHVWPVSADYLATHYHPV